MGSDGHKRKLAVILAADVEGYSRLMGADEEATLTRLAEYRREMDARIIDRGGRVVGSAGDSVLAEFPSAVEAVRCGIEVQSELGRRNAELDPERRMAFRIGINLGDVIAAEGDIFGEGVNIAARLEGLAEAGGVYISGTVYDQVKGKIEVGCDDLGPRSVKNIADPVHVYRLRLAQGTVAPALGEGPEVPSVAMLPFDNMSADPEQEYFSDGMTEDIITNLSKLSGLFVIARNSTFTYKGKAMKVQDVGADLGVRYVLEGSVRKAGERIRVSAQLVETATGHHLWAERYDRTLEDVFAVQDELSQEIASALEVRLSAGEKARLARKPTENMEAYDLLLRGRDEMMRTTREATENARALFQRALELDPDCAVAYARLAQASSITGMYGWGGAEESRRRAMELVERALELDDTVPFAHGVMGGILLWWQHDHDRALAEARRWIELDPNDADGYLNLADVLVWAGRPDEAIPLIEKSMRLNPHYSFITLFALGHAHWVRGDLDEALSAFNRGIARNPDFAPNFAFRSAILAERGEIDAARAAMDEVHRTGFDLSADRFEMIPYAHKKDLERLRRALLKLAPADKG